MLFYIRPTKDDVRDDVRSSIKRIVGKAMLSGMDLWRKRVIMEILLDTEKRMRDALNKAEYRYGLKK
jgi:hypothetical protein